jgi:hypothetical protein
MRHEHVAFQVCGQCDAADRPWIRRDLQQREKGNTHSSGLPRYLFYGKESGRFAGYQFHRQDALSHRASAALLLQTLAARVVVCPWARTQHVLLLSPMHSNPLDLQQQDFEFEFEPGPIPT